jgi:hypothetical protein
MAPLAIAADRRASYRSATSETIMATVAYSTPTQTEPSRRLNQPQFIGPSQLHNGLLPNGLTPNPPSYG